jgi:protein SCO1/2
MKHLSFITIVLIFAIGAGYWNFKSKPNHSTLSNASTSLQTGTALNTPRDLPKISFTTQTGAAFNKQNLKGKWNFVFFGYSTCPELCPTTLQAMKQLSQRVGKGVPVQYLFVSIDPERDTPERLQEYLSSNLLKDVGFIGLNAPKEDVLKLAQQIGIYFEAEQTDETHIAHSGAIVLINPNAQLDAIFTDSKQPGIIAQDFKSRVSNFARA